ncbi:MAG: helix-hairpin-helix domain-containing protein [Chloroflexota bacterium]|nr:helix-hairpin-helix domain-containing protein [Chloroflexota bacterium]
MGPARRKILLKAFGSLNAIRAASVEQLAAVPGIPSAVALAVKEHL